MKLARVIFVALAVLLPVSWTAAKAEDAPAPAGDMKKEKKAKKGKKADKPAEDKKEMTK